MRRAQVHVKLFKKNLDDRGSDPYNTKVLNIFVNYIKFLWAGGFSAFISYGEFQFNQQCLQVLQLTLSLTLFGGVLKSKYLYSRIRSKDPFNALSSIFSHLRHHFDMEDFCNRTGHEFENLVQHCRWRNTLCQSSSWITKYTHYNKCYTFNSKGDHVLHKAGAGQ